MSKQQSSWWISFANVLTMYKDYCYKIVVLRRLNASNPYVCILNVPNLFLNLKQGVTLEIYL